MMSKECMTSTQARARADQVVLQLVDQRRCIARDVVQKLSTTVYACMRSAHASVSGKHIAANQDGRVCGTLRTHRGIGGGSGECAATLLHGQHHVSLAPAAQDLHTPTRGSNKSLVLARATARSHTH